LRASADRAEERRVHFPKRKQKIQVVAGAVPRRYLTTSAAV
jgi:hypothetical protein